MPTHRQLFLRAATCFAVGLFLASAASALLFTVTLKNGTTFETRERPVVAEWDEDYAMFLTDKGNWIALRKDEIADVTTESEATGFGYQADSTTLFVGWTPGDILTGEEGEGGEGGAPPPPPDDTPIEYGGDSGSSYGMDQFLDIPTGGGSIQTMSLGPSTEEN